MNAGAKYLAALACLGLSALACSGRQGEAMDPSTMPEAVRGDYAIFAARCSKCHALARPLNASIVDDEQWAMYVARMRRQPGSGISAEDQVAVLRFLSFYSADRRAKKASSLGASSAPMAVPDAGSAVDGGQQ